MKEAFVLSPNEPRLSHMCLLRRDMTENSRVINSSLAVKLDLIDFILCPVIVFGILNQKIGPEDVEWSNVAFFVCI